MDTSPLAVVLSAFKKHFFNIYLSAWKAATLLQNDCVGYGKRSIYFIAADY